MHWCAPMVASYYIQVLSLGLVWTFFHCSGMCGPLVAGLTSRTGDDGSRARRLWLRARRVLAYQSGRALTYAVMGATAGLVGAQISASVEKIAALSALAVAPVFALLGIARLAGKHVVMPGLGQKISALYASAIRFSRRVTWLRGDVASSAATGLVMGLLPCMLMFWVLGVAATTGSPLHGAGVMVLLVVLTTPTLLAAGCAASIWRIAWSERFVGGALLFSATWLGLVGAAANGWIDHFHITFELAGEPYMLMLF